MKLLVTGATGFIGSHLVEALAAGTAHGVAIVKRKASPYRFSPQVEGKISTFLLEEACENLPEILAKARPDCVIHLASWFLSTHRPEEVTPLIQANVTFPTMLLEAMAQAGVRKFINTGTSWEYFNGAKTYDPVNLYAATKRAFEDLLLYYIKAHQMSAVTLKLFDTYGSFDPRPKLFSVLKKARDTKEPVPFSPGEQRLDLLHVEDAAAAFVKAVGYIESQPSIEHEEFFIGSGESVRLKDLVKLYQELSGSRLNILWGARPYREREVMIVHADIQAAREKLGWQPVISLTEGIRRMLEEEGGL